MTTQISESEYAALIEAGYPEPHSGVEIVPDQPMPHIPAGAVAVEQDAHGHDSVFEHEGVRYYTPASHPYSVGFRNSEEFKKAQSLGATLGPHEGDKVPEDTVVYLEGGKPVARYSREKLVKERPNLEPDRLRYSIKTHAGREKLLTEQEYTKLGELTGKEQFNEAKSLGIIPKSARYVGGEGDSWEYQTGYVGKDTAKRKLAKELQKEREAKQRQIQLLAPTTIVVDTKGVPKVDKPSSVVKDIWQTLTPWDESQETFADYMKEWPQRIKETFVGAKPKKQSLLKQEYEEYKNAPMWTKILFPTRIGYDSRTNRYYQLSYSEGPATGKKKIIDTARRTVKTLDKVDWKKVKAAVVNARIKQAVDAASKVKTPGVLKAKRQIAQGTKDYKKYLEGLKRLEVKAKGLTSKEIKALRLQGGPKGLTSKELAAQGWTKPTPAQVYKFQSIISSLPTRTLQEYAAVSIALNEDAAPMWDAASKAAEYAREKQRYGTAQQQKYATQAMAAVALSNAFQMASLTQTSVQTQVQEELKSLPVSKLKN